MVPTSDKVRTPLHRHYWLPLTPPNTVDFLQFLRFPPAKLQDFFYVLTSWWFQPIWKILVKMGIFPKIGVKIKNLWNHHPVNLFQNKLPCNNHVPNVLRVLCLRCLANILNKEKTCLFLVMVFWWKKTYELLSWQVLCSFARHLGRQNDHPLLICSSLSTFQFHFFLKKKMHQSHPRWWLNQPNWRIQYVSIFLTIKQIWNHHLSLRNLHLIAWSQRTMVRWDSVPFNVLCKKRHLQPRDLTVRPKNRQSQKETSLSIINFPGLHSCKLT